MESRWAAMMLRGRSIGSGMPRQALALTTPRVLMLILTVPTGVLIARTYGAEGKGLVATFGAAVVIVSSIIDPGLGESIAVQARAGRGLRYPRRSVLILWFSLGAFAATVVSVSGAGTIFNLCLVGAAMLSILITEGAVVTLALHSPRAWAWGQFIQPAGYFVAVAALAGLHAPVPSIVVAYACALVLPVAYFVRRIPPFVDSSESLLSGGWRTLSYGFLRHLTNLGQLFMLRFDVLLIGWLMTSSAVGIYSVSYNLAELVSMVPTSMAALTFNRELSKRGTISSSALARGGLLMAGVSAVVLAILSPIAIKVLYGNAFAPSIAPLLLLLPGEVALGVLQVLAASYYARGAAGRMARLTWAAVVPGMVLTVLLVATYGVVGAAIATTLTYGLLCLVVLRDARSTLDAPAVVSGAGGQALVLAPSEVLK